jgi:hypothetical protein
MLVVFVIVGALVMLPVVADLVGFLLRRVPPVALGGGDPDKGIAIFAESIRFAGVPWGTRECEAGLREAGFEGEFRYWAWQEPWQGWLVLPAIMDAPMLEREAKRLAEFIEARRREREAAPIYLIGFSCGAYVAIRALELLDEDVRVDAAATLAGAFDPRRDLSTAMRHVHGRLVVCSSLADWMIVGLGTMLFGTGDRKHTLSAGMTGLRPQAAPNDRLHEIRWRPSLIRQGCYGGHFTAPAANFITHHLAPKMGINDD